MYCMGVRVCESLDDSLEKVGCYRLCESPIYARMRLKCIADKYMNQDCIDIVLSSVEKEQKEAREVRQSGRRATTTCKKRRQMRSSGGERGAGALELAEKWLAMPTGVSCC